MTFDVRTPSTRFLMKDEMRYRTYTRHELKDLLARVGRFETLQTYDFCYEIDDPIEIDALTEDVVYILKKS